MEAIRGEIVGLEFDTEIDGCSIMRVSYPEEHQIGHEMVMILSMKEYKRLLAFEDLVKFLNKQDDVESMKETEA